MPKRRENMLEAFKASLDQEVRSQARASRRGAVDPPESQDPGEVRPPERPRAPEPFPDDLELPVEEGLLLPIGAWPFVGLQLVALGLSFFLGYLAAGPADAVRAGAGADARGGADGSRVELADPRDPAQRSTAGPQRGPSTPAEGAASTLPSTDGSAPSAADLAFEDPANLFTVVVFSVNDYAFGRERIWELYRFLSQQGFDPITPRTCRGYLMLLVGASPTMGELEAVKLRLRDLVGPDGRTRPFRDAYINNASSYR